MAVLHPSRGAPASVTSYECALVPWRNLELEANKTCRGSAVLKKGHIHWSCEALLSLVSCSRQSVTILAACSDQHSSGAACWFPHLAGGMNRCTFANNKAHCTSVRMNSQGLFEQQSLELSVGDRTRSALLSDRALLRVCGVTSLLKLTNRPYGRSALCFKCGLHVCRLNEPATPATEWHRRSQHLPRCASVPVTTVTGAVRHTFDHHWVSISGTCG